MVYEGRVVTNGARGLRKGDAVVLKRPKLTVEGAAELQEIELWMNDRVNRDARGACAEFVGSYRVTRDEWMSSPSSDVLSKEGLWLVWRYQGDRTLAQYLAQPDYPTGLSKALLKREDVYRGDAATELEITQKAVSQLLSSLMSLHRAGLVHRDVKPHNLVLAQSAKPEFKVIDLGACACFRTGTNFTPDETIMDPKYAPPEEFLIPTEDAPDLKNMFGPLALAAGTTAWLSHKPDRFDMYSTGIVLMQLAMPSLRTNSGLQGFNKNLKKYKYNLLKWRDANQGSFSRSKTAVLDAGDGAGWELAAALLRQRPYDAEGEEDSRERYSAEEALKHRFFSVNPTELKVLAKEGRGDNWVADTTAMLSDMFSLEKRIQRQQANIAKQSTTIQKLKDDGADARSIAEQEKTLEKMRVGLQGLVRALSFKDVEARTTMVSAASDLQKAAKDKGVEPSKEYDGLLSELSTGTAKKRVEAIERQVSRVTEQVSQVAAQGASETKRRVEDGVTNILRFVRSARESQSGDSADEQDQEDDVQGEASDPEKTNGAFVSREPSMVTKGVSEASTMPAPNGNSANDQEALRLRMEAIQNEMNAVIAEMAEMEQRLMEQQKELQIDEVITIETTSSKKAKGSVDGEKKRSTKNGGTVTGKRNSTSATDILEPEESGDT